MLVSNSPFKCWYSPDQILKSQVKLRQEHSVGKLVGWFVVGSKVGGCVGNGVVGVMVGVLIVGIGLGWLVKGDILGVVVGKLTDGNKLGKLKLGLRVGWTDGLLVLGRNVGAVVDRNRTLRKGAETILKYIWCIWFEQLNAAVAVERITTEKWRNQSIWIYKKTAIFVFI